MIKLENRNGGLGLREVEKERRKGEEKRGGESVL